MSVAIVSPVDGLELLRPIARGLDLEVFEAWDERRACPVVAKLVRQDRRDDPEAIERLRLEGERLTALAHPHLVRAFELREGPCGPVLVLETLGGETLSHRVADAARPLAVSELAWLGLHVSSALHYLHGEGLLHLDLKASNVIDDRGVAKLIDLSLARPPGPVPAGWGTPEYLSPEQAAAGEASVASDVWGLGGVLYVAATGRRPFARPAAGAPFAQLDSAPRPVGELRALPPALAQAVDACFAADPGDRPALEDLAVVLDDHAAD